MVCSGEGTVWGVSGRGWGWKGWAERRRSGGERGQEEGWSRKGGGEGR